MNHAEATLLTNLTDPDSLDYLVREGFSTSTNRECIPTESIRDIVGWTLDFFYRSGRKVAPTKDGISETWSKEFERLEFVLDDEYETDSVEWCVEELRSQFVGFETQEFTIRMANDVFHAAPPDKITVLRGFSEDLHALCQKVSSHHQEMAADLGFEDAWARYQERATARNFVSGLTFGLEVIDNHIMGIKDGELAIFAAGSGDGKSFASIKAARAEWMRGRRTALFTLENSIEMTYDRMACMASGISYERWQRGTVDEGGLARFHAAMQRLKETEHAPIVLQPESGDRSPVAMVRRALSLGAESIIIDQLSHVEPVAASRSMKRNEVIAEIIRECKALISQGREQIPMLLLAQINREGKANARKTGLYVMEDLAESSEIERTADFVFSVIKQPTETNEDGALWQMLKARRVPQKDWEMVWRLGVGDLRVIREMADA